MSIHRAHRRSTAASVVFSDPLDALYILRRRLRRRCCIIRAHLPPPSPPLSLYITQARCLAPAAFVVVSDPLDASCIPCPLPKSPSSSLIPRAHLTLPTSPSLLSIPWARKHTVASAVGDVHYDALLLLLPQPMSPLLSSISWAHPPLPTSPSWSPIPQARHGNTAVSVVVPKSSPPLSLSLIPRRRRLQINTGTRTQ